MFDDLKELFAIFTFVVVAFLILFGLVFGVLMWTTHNYCETLQEINPNREFFWDVWTGCLVLTDTGFWVNPDNYYQLEKVK